MTYNFDPERWYELRKLHLESRLERHEIDGEQFERELRELWDRYERMVEELDGTFRLPD